MQECKEREGLVLLNGEWRRAVILPQEGDEILVRIGGHRYRVAFDDVIFLEDLEVLERSRSDDGSSGQISFLYQERSCVDDWHRENDRIVHELQIEGILARNAARASELLCGF